MGLLRFFRKDRPEAQSRPSESKAQINASQGAEFTDLHDPELHDFMRGGKTASGAYVDAKGALQNMAILRCVTLISESIGMLPVNLIERGNEKRHAREHAVYRLLKTEPNGWQTPYEFKALMQLRLLTKGNAYALIIRTLGRPVRLVPLDPDRVTPKQRGDWSIEYEYVKPNGDIVIHPGKDILHLRDLSDDGIIGLSRVKLAKEAIGIALQAEKAASRLFTNGVMAGGALSTPNALSDSAYERLKKSMDEKAGSSEAHKWLILEEGLSAEKYINTAADAQHLESRNHQIEEVARAFGVPRPLLMMDDTSWGSGIEQLGIFFVQYSLQHWFTVWEQAITRTLLDGSEKDTYYPKFNERALMRGTLNDQANFFTKALGSGGHGSWMTPNEVRGLQDLPEDSSATSSELQPPSSYRGKTDESNKTA